MCLETRWIHVKFYKLLLYDLHQGLIKPWIKLVPILLLFIVALVGANNYFAEQGICMSTGDFLVYLLQGDFPYIPNSETPFKIPVLWFVIQVYLPYYLGNYPTNDLKGVGQNILLKVPDRRIWWTVKVFWSILASIFYMALIVLVACVFGISNGMPSLQVTNSFAETILLSEEFILLGKAQIFYIVVLPLLTMICVSLLQIMLSFVWQPFVSMIVIVTLYVAAAYGVSPFLITAYSMIFRNKFAILNGVSVQFGIPYLCICSILFAAIGYLAFSRYDILDNSKEV